MYIYIYIHVYICICIRLRTFTCSLWSWKMLKVPRDDHERICVVFFRLLLRMDQMDHQHFIVPGGALVFLTHFPCKPCFTYQRWFFLGNCCWKPYMANPEKCNIEPRGGFTSCNLWTWLWTNSICISHLTKKRWKRYERITFLDCI